MRQTSAKLRPFAAVVQRVVKSIAGSRKQQTLGVRVFGDAADVGELMLRQRVADFFPGLTKIGGFIDKWFAVIVEMVIDRDVRRPCVKRRGPDAGDASPSRQTGDVLRDIVPMRSVFGVPD